MAASTGQISVFTKKKSCPTGLGNWQILHPLPRLTLGQNTRFYTPWGGDFTRNSSAKEFDSRGHKPNNMADKGRVDLFFQKLKEAGLAHWVKEFIGKYDHINKK